MVQRREYALRRRDGRNLVVRNGVFWVGHFLAGFGAESPFFWIDFFYLG
jgi:hypothetical protein